MKWQFSYGYASNMTVTVQAKTREEAVQRACSEMNRRYDRRGYEPPVGWTLRLLKKTK
jgi:hypothetical protein